MSLSLFPATVSPVLDHVPAGVLRQAAVRRASSCAALQCVPVCGSVNYWSSNASRQPALALNKTHALSQCSTCFSSIPNVCVVVCCAGVLPGEVLLQSLPCVVAAQALNPQPGSRVLDMCAAPGGKTSVLAQMMAGNSSSRLLALDRTAAKAARVRQLVGSWGVGDVVQVLAADATQLYQQAQAVSLQQPDDASDGLAPDEATSSSSSSITADTTSSSRSSKQRSRRKKPGQQDQQQQAELLAAAEPESFDAVLLDAPCSALGLRPRLLMDWRLPQLQALAAYQRALLHAAVHVLKPGGSLVYCTCTINPGEDF